MGAENVVKQKGVSVKIDGKEYWLRYTMASLAQLATKYGNVTNVLGAFDKMADGIVGIEQLEAYAELTSAAIIHMNDEYTPDYVSNNFDFSEIVNITPKLVEAFLLSMGASKSKAKNPQKA